MNPVTEPACYLRRYERSDAPDLAALLTDERVMRFIGKGRPIDHNKAARAIDDEVLAKEADPAFYIRSIRVGEQYAGHAELFCRPDREEHELMYLLVPRFWGRGIGSRVVDLLLEEARTRELQFVTATVHPDNAASIAILTRRGFLPDALLSEDLGFPAYRLELQ